MCVEALQKQFSLNTFYQKIYVWKCRIGFSFWTTMSIKLEMKIYLLFISRKKRHCLFSKLSVCKSRKKTVVFYKPLLYGSKTIVWEQLWVERNVSIMFILRMCVSLYH